VPGWRGIRVKRDGCPGEEIYGLVIEVFKEGDMEGIEHHPRCHVPKAISFCVRCIPDENAGAGSLVNFGIVCLNKGKGMAANFPEV
jgi:hypothetical protein